MYDHKKREKEHPGKKAFELVIMLGPDAELGEGGEHMGMHDRMHEQPERESVGVPAIDELFAAQRQEEPREDEEDLLARLLAGRRR